MDIKCAVILITSASSIFGRALALHYARLGARLILCDQDETSLRQITLQCQTINPDVHYYPMLSTSAQEVDALFDYIERTYQQTPDVLINHWPNAPFPSFLSEHASTQFFDQWNRLTANFFSFGYTCAERMRSSGVKGVIVNVISYNETLEMAGIESAASMVAGFTHSWAKELTPFNIRVGGVIPQLVTEPEFSHGMMQCDELTRHTEYIVANEYFSGRVVSA